MSLSQSGSVVGEGRRNAGRIARDQEQFRSSIAQFTLAGVRTDSNNSRSRHLSTGFRVRTTWECFGRAQTGDKKLQLGSSPKPQVLQASRASKAGKPYTGAPNHNLPR